MRHILYCVANPLRDRICHGQTITSRQNAMFMDFAMSSALRSVLGPTFEAGAPCRLSTSPLHYTGVVNDDGHVSVPMANLSFTKASSKPALLDTGHVRNAFRRGRGSQMQTADTVVRSCLASAICICNHPSKPSQWVTHTLFVLPCLCCKWVPVRFFVSI